MNVQRRSTVLPSDRTPCSWQGWTGRLSAHDSLYESLALWVSEPRFREMPNGPLTSGNPILSGSPTSLAYHKALRAWFAAKLKASHGGE